jgi:hypothetical protein
MKTSIRFFELFFAFLCLALLPNAQAVVPPPDGGYPGFTTAEGTNALKNLTTGVGNTAVGWYSLFGDTTASFNTAVGAGTLLFNNGDQNTAVGVAALLSNTTGGYNTATGVNALGSNTTGFSNVAIGGQALADNTTGWQNTAVGGGALRFNTTGTDNAALGGGAGQNITGSGNVCIGVIGVAGVSDTTWIRNVYSSVATARAVYVNSDNKIGTLASSRRFKEEIKPMEKASEVLFALKPVSFRYKKEFDAGRAPMFGLIAEEVEQVDPDLVSRNEKGEVQTVRYEQINAMLLNEFLKEHQKVQQQAATIAQLKSTVEKQAAINAQQQRQIEALTAGLQKVSAQIEISERSPNVARNNQLNRF